MPIYYGGKKLQSLYFGGKKIASAWYGGKCVYRSGIAPGTVLWSGDVYNSTQTIYLSDKISNTQNGISIYFAKQITWAAGNGGDSGDFVVYPQKTGVNSPNILVKKSVVGKTISIEGGVESDDVTFTGSLKFDNTEITIYPSAYYWVDITKILAY
ncbi:hypothetical protein [Schleiferilactobacillus harbinensis]|uniref:hypothetical protein n=1 Tax=Schleiferilactobacillus harbinensis TaxID=304207 RepID=UPI00345E0F59